MLVCVSDLASDYLQSQHVSACALNEKSLLLDSRGPQAAEQFIEVKSSLALTKAFFEMSHQEVDMARRFGDHYCVYRVTGVGTSNPTILRIVNPMQKWAAGHIKVCIVV